MVVLLSVAAMMCKSFIDFLSNKVITSDNSSINRFYFLETCTIVLIILFAYASGMLPIRLDFPSLYYGVGIGLLSFASYFLYLLSFRGEHGSVYITVYRLNFIVSSVIAVVVLNELLTVNRIVGLALCITAILLFLNVKGNKINFDPPMLFCICASVLTGIMNIFNKIALAAGVETNTLLFYRYAIVLITTYIYFKISKQDLKTNLKSSKGLVAASLVCGMLMFVSMTLLYNALRIGAVTIVTPIVESCFIFSSVLCFVFLKEKISLKKFFGIVLAVVSIIIIGM